jgi:hypothetical protein
MQLTYVVRVTLVALRLFLFGPSLHVLEPQHLMIANLNFWCLLRADQSLKKMGKNATFS